MSMLLSVEDLNCDYIIAENKKVFKKVSANLYYCSELAEKMSKIIIDNISAYRYNIVRGNFFMIEQILKKQNMTKYRLAVEAGIPHATLNDICSGKTRIEKCSAETIYKLAKVLGVSMEMLTIGGIQKAERERAYEYGLPEYLQHDLDAYKEGLKNHSALLDCLWCELYASINVAEINDNVITAEHAEFLRAKYLFGGKYG